MRRSRRLIAPLVVLAGSQAGHLVSYLVRFGPAGLGRQAEGRHGYFPILISALSSLVGACILLGLLVMAGSRLRRGRRLGLRASGRAPLFDLLPVLFTIQLALNLGQETVEAVASGAAPAPLPELLLWGAIGQLPMAILGSLAAGWLFVTLGAAVAELEAEAVAIRAWVAIAGPFQLAAVPAISALRVCAPAVFAKRGPPGNLVIRS